MLAHSKKIYLFLFILCPIAVEAQITSNFSTNDEGWTIADVNNLNPQTVNYNAGGGNPGGYLSVTYNTNQPSYWTAPAKFLGEHCLSSYGLNLKFDLEFSASVGLVHASSGDVILYNNTTAIAVNLPSFPSTASWASYSIKLDTAAKWHNGSPTGTLSTHNDILFVLGNLTKIRINGQYKFAIGTISSLDNVILETTSPGTPPVIASFTPKSGLPALTSVTITGSNFNSTASSNIVYFGGVKATVTSATTGKLVVAAPPGAQYSPITVVNLSTGLEASTVEPFHPMFDNNKDYGGQIIRATMGTPITFDLESPNGWSEAGDIDGDGLNDMIVGETSLKKFSVFRNNGVAGNITSTSFAPKVSFAMKDAGKGYMALADFDGDGKLDVAISEGDGFQAYIAVFHNTSTPGFVSFDNPLYYYGLSYSDGPLTAGDMDGDGRPEIVGVFNNNCGSSNRVYILPNRSKPGAIDFCTYALFGPVYTCGGFITLGDLDGDKLQDVVVTSASGTNIATVLRNTSTPAVFSMATPFTLTTTNLEGRALIADLDNDGKNDIGWPYYSTSVEIRKNLYTGGVLDATSFSAGSILSGTVGFTGGTSELVTADINSDGKLDLIANGSDNMSVWQNVSTTGVLNASSFLPGIPYPTPSNGLGMESPRMADFDGDNKPDIFIKVSSTAVPASLLKIYVYHNESYPVPRIDNLLPSSGSIGSTVTFTGDYMATGLLPTVNGRLGPLATTITTSSNTAATSTVPINSFSNRFSLTEHGLTAFTRPFNVLFGTNKIIDAASFPASVDFPLAINLRDALEVADFDDDGKVDIATIDSYSTAKIFQNTQPVAGQAITASSLTLQSTTYSAGYNLIALDIDGDGKVDLNNGYGLIKNSSTPGAISFLYGPSGTYTYASSFNGVAASDFNKDGKVDLAVTNGSASLQLYENRSTKEPFINNSNFSTFNITPVNLSKPGNTGVVTVADFDSDGYDDLAVTTNSTNNFTFYRNLGHYGPLGALSFSAGTNVTTGAQPYGLTANDFDGDGKIDIAVTHFSALYVSVYLNTSTTGAISFAAPATFTTVNKGYNLTSQDLDGDGKAEIIVIHQPNPGPGSFTVLQNKSVVGAVNFSTTNYPLTRNPQQLNIADINADRKPDILIVANSGTIGNALMVFENKIVLTPLLTITQQPTNALACAGSIASFTINASGQNNIHYQWLKFDSTKHAFKTLVNNTFYSGVTSSTLTIRMANDSTQGSYACNITDDNANAVFSDTVNVTLTSPPPPTITAGASTLEASAGDDYQWYSSGITIPGATSQTLSIPIFEYGVYMVEVQINGCTSRSADFIYLVTNVEYPSATLKIYPNPVENELIIEASGTLPYFVMILDLMGKETNTPVIETDLNKTVFTKELPPGQYILVIQTDRSKNYYKIIKM